MIPFSPALFVGKSVVEKREQHHQDRNSASPTVPTICTNLADSRHLLHVPQIEFNYTGNKSLNNYQIHRF